VRVEESLVVREESGKEEASQAGSEDSEEP
jgi:hypothetical protein